MSVDNRKEAQKKMKQINSLIRLLNKKLEEVSQPLNYLNEDEIYDYLLLCLEDLRIIEFDVHEYTKRILQKDLGQIEGVRLEPNKWKSFNKEYSQHLNKSILFDLLDRNLLNKN
ncbi:MAG: hypothetical protein EA412_11105 [Chitinophagaceae bacterium]|nr:MAG: hypothetical protein EA412_11105 [Chitinophagaceae bacterium]